MKKYLTILAAALMICACSQPAMNFTGKISAINADTIVVCDQETGAQQAFAVANASELLLGSPVVVKYAGSLDSAATVKAQKVVADSTYTEAVGTWMTADSSMTVKVDVQGVASSSCDTLIVSSWALAGPVHEVIFNGTMINGADTSDFTTTATIAMTADGKFVMTEANNGLVLNKQ